MKDAKRSHVRVDDGMKVSFPLLLGTIELYPQDGWSGLQSIFCKEMITVLDVGKFTLQTMGTEIAMETKYEPSERKSPFELIIAMLYGPNADVTKELRKTPISMSPTQLQQLGDWALNMTSNVEEMLCIILNMRLRNTPQEYRSISKSFWSKLRNQRRKEKLSHHHVIAEDETSMVLGDVIWIRRTNNLTIEYDGISHRVETWCWEVCDDQCAKLILIRNNGFILPNIQMKSGLKTIKMDRMGQFYSDFEVSNTIIPLLVVGIDYTEDQDEFMGGTSTLQMIGIKTEIGIFLCFVKKLADFNAFKPNLQLTHLLMPHVYKPELFDHVVITYATSTIGEVLVDGFCKYEVLTTID